MHFYIPGFTRVMMSSEALEALLHSAKMSFVWCMVCSAETKTLHSEKGRVQTPSQEEGVQVFHS